MVVASVTVAQYKIRKYLKDNQISHIDIAKKLGYNHNCIQWIYKGHLPNIVNIKNYEQLFDIKNDFGTNKTKMMLLDKYKFFSNMQSWYELQTGFKVDRNSLASWMNGKRSPSFPKLKRFCECFDIKNEWIEEAHIVRHHKTTARRKIRAKIGYNIKANYPDLGISIHTFYAIFRGSIPNKETQLKINSYFGIRNDFIDKPVISNLEQRYIDFILDTKIRLGYMAFNKIMRGVTCRSKHMIDVCKYFNMQNDYYI